jgi:hypothetical protein
MSDVKQNDGTLDIELSADELVELLDLVKGSDSIELKLTVPASGQRSAISTLGIDALDAQIRQVFFFDTPDLALNRVGVVARARRIQGKGGDSVIKLRPVVPDQLPGHLRRSPSLGVEVDAMPGGFVCSASMKGKNAIDDAREAHQGNRSIRKLFTKEQRAFYKQHAPDGLSLDDLHVLGPIFVLKLKYVPEGFDRPLVGEMWLYPDGTRIMELSTKCLPGQGFEVAAELKAYLGTHGIDLGGEQQTKTKTALEFFANELQSAH